MPKGPRFTYEIRGIKFPTLYLGNLFCKSGDFRLAKNTLYTKEIWHIIPIDMNMSEEIILRRACDYIEERAIKHIDLVKIDVEGHELKVLEGFESYLDSDFIDFIQFEYGGTNLDSHTSLLDIFGTLEKKYFIVAKIFPKGLELRTYHPYMENFMYANYVAISKNMLNSLFYFLFIFMNFAL